MLPASDRPATRGRVVLQLDPGPNNRRPGEAIIVN